MEKRKEVNRWGRMQPIPPKDLESFLQNFNKYQGGLFIGWGKSRGQWTSITELLDYREKSRWKKPGRIARIQSCQWAVSTLFLLMCLWRAGIVQGLREVRECVGRRQEEGALTFHPWPRVAVPDSRLKRMVFIEAFSHRKRLFQDLFILKSYRERERDKKKSLPFAEPFSR